MSGDGCPDLVARTGDALAAAGTGLHTTVLAGAALEHVEGLARHGGGALAGPADLVWCAPGGTASSLAGLQRLGRWVRSLACRRVDILLADERGEGGEADLGALRRRVGLVAPGVPVGITVAGPARWTAVCADLAARLAGAAGSGSP